MDRLEAYSVVAEELGKVVEGYRRGSDVPREVTVNGASGARYTVAFRVAATTRGGRVLHAAIHDNNPHDFQLLEESSELPARAGLEGQ